jgi:hypothetical protein
MNPASTTGERSAAMTKTLNRDKDQSPYASTSPMLAVGFLALLLVLILKVMGG